MINETYEKKLSRFDKKMVEIERNHINEFSGVLRDYFDHLKNPNHLVFKQGISSGIIEEILVAFNNLFPPSLS